MWCKNSSKAVMMTFVCALMLTFALPAVAQTQGPMRDQGKGVSALTGLSLDQGVLGKNVRTRSGENIGTIDDVIFSRWGRIAHYLVEVNPFQGIGEKIVALNPDQVQVTGQDHILFNGTRADLESLPQVDPYAYGLYRGYYGPSGSYGYRPSYGPGPSSRSYYGPYGGGEQYQERQGQYRQGGWQGQEPYPRRGYYEQGQGSMRQSPGWQREQARRFMGRTISSDDFLSAQVFDPQRNLIGEVQDLVIDPASNRVTYAVIGVENKQVLVPLRELRYAGGDSVIYRGAEGQLEEMPEYNVGKGGSVAASSSPAQQKAGSSAKAGGVQQQSGGGQAQTQEQKSSPQQR